MLHVSEAFHNNGLLLSDFDVILKTQPKDLNGRLFFSKYPKYKILGLLDDRLISEFRTSACWQFDKFDYNFKLDMQLVQQVTMPSPKNLSYCTTLATSH